jgi:hypothetical protein
MIAILAGCALAILILRAAHWQWNEFLPILALTVLFNGLTATLSRLLFRRDPVGMHPYRLTIWSGYVVGVGGGIYLYYT